MKHFELPPTKHSAYTRAIRLEWLTIGYLLTAIAAIYLTLGNSQAMKTAWIEDMLSLIPPIVFLIADRIRQRPPNEIFPYGYHRVVSIAYLVASFALFLVGALLLADAALKLAAAEHPSIGTVELFGHHVWLGWLMEAALLYSAVPAIVLGRLKVPLARELHDKVLFADAKMNKADWLTAVAAMAGVLGIGLGLWWADAVAAAVISIDIVHDGFVNLRTVVTDLMDKRPTTVDDSAVDPLTTRVEREMHDLNWVREARARLREEGHVYFGEVFVVPKDGTADLVERVREAHERLLKLDWRLHDIVVAVTPEIEHDEAGLERESQSDHE
ncbi:MAG TPA: cation diffusion facilitator family transporter [Actinomycetota bacterium]|nr:cation diffusion facilitator family transporter [Actinomycetota bacterium]